MIDEIRKMIQDAEKFSEPAMKKLNNMDIKEVFNFMDNFLLDQDISLHVGKEFLQDASTHYDVKYNQNKELEEITLKMCNYYVLTLKLDILGISCHFKGEHSSTKTIIRLSWKYLKDIMFKN